MDERSVMPRRGLAGCLTVAGMLFAAGALAVLLGLAAVRTGALVGPPLELRLGPYYLVARATEHPACLPLPAQCFIPRPTFQVPQPRYYSVWAGRLHPSRTSAFVEARGRLILKLPIGLAVLSP